MSQIVFKTAMKLVTSLLVSSWVKLLTKFSIFRVIKSKFGGGVNSEALISYLMSILPNKMNLIR